MTVFRGTQMTKVNSSLVNPPGFKDGTVRVFSEDITLNSQTTSDTIEVASLPKGAVPLYGVISTSVSLSTSTVAIGITGTIGKYRAAATLTSTAPEVFGVNAGIGVALTAAETVFITIGIATLPSSGTLRVQLYYAFN